MQPAVRWIREISVRSKRVVVLCAVALIIGGICLAAFRLAGEWLVTEDPVKPALAAVVFGGQVPFRAMQAAALYNEGTVGEVWLTQGDVAAEDRKLAELGIERLPEFEYSRRVLTRLGVPATAIRVLPGENTNTADEIRTVARELRSRANGRSEVRVILVSSKAHSRRVKVLWRALAASVAQGIVRYSKEDPYRPEAWWRTSGDASEVAHEWFGLFNAWAGFPLTSRAR